MKINKRIASSNKSSKKIPPAGNGNMLDNIIDKNKKDKFKSINNAKRS